MHASSVAGGRTRDFRLEILCRYLEAQCQIYSSRLIHLLLLPGFIFRYRCSYCRLIFSLQFFLSLKNKGT